MAKRLLYNVLIQVLGEFIELNEENLNLAVWSGQIVLHNPKLKTDKLLRNFNLAIEHGTVKSLEITIPWASLMSSPIRIVIDGVYLQVGPYNLDYNDKIDTLKRIMELKLHKLSLVDKFMELSRTLDPAHSINTPASNNDEYWQSWTTKIFDNIEISINNVHVRYEDTLTIPGKTFAFGVTLSSFEILTCDRNWLKPDEVHPTANNNVNNNTANDANTIRKIANIYNFGIYWDPDTTSLRGMLLEKWVMEMQLLIYTRSGAKLGLQYILSPYNNFVMRLIHNRSADSKKPAYDAFMQSTNMHVAVDSQQYVQLFHVLDRLDAQERQRQPHSYYPQLRPKSVEGVKQWWRYACKLVIKRPRYMNLVKLQKLSEQRGNGKSYLSLAEEYEKNQLEIYIPLPQLILFRQAALQEMQDEAKKFAQAKAAADVANTSWWGSWLGGAPAVQNHASLPQSKGVTGTTIINNNNNNNSNNKKQDDIPIDTLLEKLSVVECNNHKAVNANPKRVQFQVCLETGATMTVSHNNIPLLYSKVSTSLSFVKTPLRVFLRADLKTLSMVDKFTIDPPIPNIIAVRSSTSTANTPNSATASSNQATDNEKESLRQRISQMIASNQIVSDAAPVVHSTNITHSSNRSTTPTTNATTITSPFTICFESVEGKSKILASALPVEVTLNKDCINKVINAFARPVTPYQAYTTSRTKNPNLSATAIKRKTLQKAREGSKSNTNNTATARGGYNDNDSPFHAANMLLNTALQSKAVQDVFAMHREDALEIVLEMNAPKFVVPEDCCSESGYLLFDMGYFVMNGFLGTSGFSMSLALRDINAGLPLTTRDLYNLREQSLYLIKPFDVNLELQNIVRADAEITVKAAVSPEIRGEVDAKKLSRLLDVLSELTSMIAKDKQTLQHGATESSLNLKNNEDQSDEPKAQANALNANAMLGAMIVEEELKARRAEGGTKSGAVVAARATTPERVPMHRTDATILALDENKSYSTPKAPTISLSASNHSIGSNNSESEGAYRTPPSLTHPTLASNSAGERLSAVRTKLATVDDDEEDEMHDVMDEFTANIKMSTIASANTVKPQFPDLPTASPNVLSAAAKAVEAFAEHISDNRSRPVEQVNPQIVLMLVEVVVPIIVLELTYNVEKNWNIVYEISTLTTKITFRPFDRQISLNLTAMSLKDSFRSATQRELIYTPPDSGDLFTVVHTAISDVRSSLCRNHAAELAVNFSNLSLSVDVHSLSHLKPFLDVLLTKNDNNGTGKTELTNDITPRDSSLQLSEIASTTDTNHDDDTSNMLTGMHVVAKLHKISLDILRAPAVATPHTELDSAFSMLLSGLDCDVDMKHLMTAHVKLKSFEIFDARRESKDYVFKRIFCPIVDGEKALTATKGSAFLDRLAEEAAFKDSSDAKSDQTKLFRVDASSDINHSDADLITVTYTQESKSQSFITVLVSNVTSFVAVDTIMDFTSITVANAFAMLDLFAVNANVSANNSGKMGVAETPRANVFASSRGSDSPTAALDEDDYYYDTSEIGSDKMNYADVRKVSASGSADASPSAKLSKEKLSVIGSDTGNVSESVRYLLNREPPSARSARLDNTKVNVMNVVVKVKDPRLILLADPTITESQAIVATCAVDMQYTREVNDDGETKAMIESLHLTASQCEVFVLPNMEFWNPRPILQPISLECHLKRKVINEITVYTNVYIDIDTVDMRVSFSDMLLAQSILSRRALKNPEFSTEMVDPDDGVGDTGELLQTAMLTATETLRGQSEDKKHEQILSVAPSLIFNFHVTSFVLVAVKDLDGQNVPLLRLTADDSRLYVEQGQDNRVRHRQYLRGDGDVEAKVDYYNSTLSLWEPVLDKWKPTLNLYSRGSSSICEIKCDHTMQWTISGSMLETLLRSYAVLFTAHDDHATSFNKTSAADTVIHNKLGDGVSLAIFDSAHKRHLMDLKSGESGAVESLPIISTRKNNRGMSFGMSKPTSVDIHFTEKLANDRSPLLHLPFRINKPMAYHLQALKKPRSDTVGHDGEAPVVNKRDSFNRRYSIANRKRSDDHTVRVVEPIAEEVYQNCRYDPLAGKWRPPFFMNDPFEWTDATCSVRRDIHLVELPSNRWEWESKWEIDYQGIIGKEIDENGWEYAQSFNHFSLVSTRRVHQSMDCVRRRRWVRYRVPIESEVNNLIRPYTVYWDVQSMKNGCRKIEIRSGFQVHNRLSFPIIISLHHSTWTTDAQFGPIAPDDNFNVPLLQSYANMLRIKADFPGYEFSQYLPCNVQAYDINAKTDVVCKGQDASVDICFALELTHVNKSLLVTLFPYLKINNKLMCDMTFQCWTIDHKIEGAEIHAGQWIKLSHINSSYQPRIKLKVGNFQWSEFVPISYTTDVLNTDKETISEGTELVVELHLPGNLELATARSKKNSTKKLVLCMRLNKVAGSLTQELDIYSKYVVIDRSGLDIFLSSKTNDSGSEIIRSTCTRAISCDSIFNEIEVTPRDPTYSLANVKKKMISGTKISVAYSKEATTPIREFMSPSATVFKSEGVSPTETIATDDASRRLISDLKVNSTRRYKAMSTDIGDSVYTDKLFKWSFLPLLFRDQLFIRTAFEDRFICTSKLLKFKLSQSAFVFVFVEANSTPMKWLSSDGFVKVSEMAIARRVHKGVMEEIHYNIYSKYVEVQSRSTSDSTSANSSRHVTPSASTVNLEILGNDKEEPSVIPRNSGAIVLLRATWESPLNSMYSVCVIPYGTDKTPGVKGDPNNLASKSLSTMKGLDRMYIQTNFKDRYDRDLANRSWSEGGNNLSFLHTHNGLVNVGVCRGAFWSEDINVEMARNSASKGSFEVDSPTSPISYQLSYELQYLPGQFSQTLQVRFMPRYVVMNCMDEPILVSQQGSDLYCEFKPYLADSWHRVDKSHSTEVHIQAKSTSWSLGTIDLNEVGASVLFLPYKSEQKQDVQDREPSREKGIVVHVEVKLGSASDNCSVVVIVWRETIENSPAMSIRNDSDVPITVRQADIEYEHDLYGRDRLYETTVLSNTAVPFGWADPECSTYMMICVGESMHENTRRIATINMLKTDQMLRLPYNFGKRGRRGEVVLSIATQRGGHVLMIKNVSEMHYLELFEEFGKSSSKVRTRMSQSILDNMNREHAGSSAVKPPSKQLFGLNFLLSSFGVSLILEKPVRREFLSLYVDDLEVKFKSRANILSLEFMMMDMQLDNYSETFIYPVMLRSNKKEIHKSVTMGEEFGGDDAGDVIDTGFLSDDEPDDSTFSKSWSKDANRSGSARSAEETSSKTKKKQKQNLQNVPVGEVPFIEFTMVYEMPTTAVMTPTFQYIALRVLPIRLEVDSATVRMLFTDLLNDLKVLRSTQAIANSVPDKWIDEFNCNLLSTSCASTGRVYLSSIYDTKIGAQRSKIFFKSLIIHPMKLTVTFIQTIFPRRSYSTTTLKSTALDLLLSLVGVERMQLRLKSFAVEDVMESHSSLIALIQNKSFQDLRSQLAQIAGSLAIIGSPVGFARKVGNGVKAFFYEPYLGAVQGSSDFLVGIGKGTTSLFSEVVAGAMDSTVAIVGTASKGLSHLSGDAEYARKRALKRQQHRVNCGGIVEGIKFGGESVFSGFSSGMTGLVKKPIQEASKSGLKGFIRGVGLGIVGAAIKPVMGITDGLSSVAYGISSQVDPNKIFVHVRPQRALEPSPNDPSELLIVPMNLQAAFEQEFVIRRAKQYKYEDVFICSVPIHSNTAMAGGTSVIHETLILTFMFVFWRKPKTLWGRVWGNISHCVFMGEAVGIMLYSGGSDGGAELAIIPCGSNQCAKRVYTAFAQNSHRMGYPSKVIPVDVMFRENSPMLKEQHYGYVELESKFNDERTTPTITNTDNDVELLDRIKSAAFLNEIDGYHFGKVNGKILREITGSESDVLKRAKYAIEQGFHSWQELDEKIWTIIWEWGSIHTHIQTCRCCVGVIINSSESPIQINRVQIIHGRNVVIFGSLETGYELESRSILPNGALVVFICAYPQSPMEAGLLQAVVNTAAFSAVFASNQRESVCESKGGFKAGFLEKTVSETWSKYVINFE